MMMVIIIIVLHYITKYVAPSESCRGFPRFVQFACVDVLVFLLRLFSCHKI